VTFFFYRYVFTGYAGYAAFGSATQGDVLLNLDSRAPSTIAAKVHAAARAVRAHERHTSQALMGLHILLALPVIIVPFRRSIEGLEMSAKKVHSKIDVDVLRALSWC
jgi:amino acid permease